MHPTSYQEAASESEIGTNYDPAVNEVSYD
jgi:hypothetical protein